MGGVTVWGRFDGVWEAGLSEGQARMCPAAPRVRARRQ